MGQPGGDRRARTHGAVPHPLLTLGLGAVAAAVPLAWTHSVAAEYTLPKLVALCGGLLLAAAGLALSRRRPAQPTCLDRPVLAALAVSASAAFCSQDRLLSLLGHYDGYTYGLWQLALCAAVFALAAEQSLAGERRVLAAALAAAGLVAAYAVLQSAGLEPFTLLADLPAGGRAVSTLGSPVYLGAFLALWVPLALHWSFGEGLEAVWSRLALALLTAGLVATVSRAAWGSAFAGSAAYLALTGRLRAPRLTPLSWAASGAAALLLLAGAGTALARRGLHWKEEGARVEIRRAAGRTFLKHPWLGEGPDAFELGFRENRGEGYVRLRGMEYQAHAHNDFLQVLATTGLLGAAAYLWLLAVMIGAARRALADAERRGLAAALAGGLLALYLNMQFNIVSLPALAGAALAAAALARAPRGEAGPPESRRLKAAGLLLLASVSLLFSLRLASADRDLKLARAAAAANDRPAATRLFLGAISANSCELKYHEAFVNYLAQIAPEAGGAARAELADLASCSGEAALACHPGNYLAYYVGGFAGLMQAAAGRPELLAQAQQRLDEGSRLDPYLVPLLQWRAKAAEMRGDAGLAAEVRRRIAYVEALNPHGT